MTDHEGGAGAAGATSRRPAGGLWVKRLPERPGMRVGGEINIGNRTVWESALDDLARTGPVVHLELAELRMVDAGGAAALVATATRLGGGGRVVLYDPPPALCRILSLLWPELNGIEVSGR
ncbi:STAS domain-containing protein [Spirillospora sp. NPDC048911]|uniref:STAS domain-containing protein n=1 Tax=Spirillospora sp. NPDC048911 TaxID=3364527 RepID=UPI003716BA5E